MPDHYEPAGRPAAAPASPGSLGAVARSWYLFDPVVPALFISALSLDLPERKGVPARGLELVDALKPYGFELLMPLVFPGYDSVEIQIDRADALIALIDEYWTSSTWKATELTYALDGCGALHRSARPTPKPVFVYWLERELRLPWLSAREGMTVLPSDPALAAQHVGCWFGIALAGQTG